MLCEPDPLLNCPYDIAHNIHRTRMPFHIPRCAENHVRADKMICLYNSLHIVDRLEYKYHLENCENRGIVFDVTFEDDTGLTGVIPIEDIINAIPPVQSEENWDVEYTGTTTYNPLHNIEERQVLRQYIGASKAKKKQLKRAERERISRLANQNMKPVPDNIVPPMVKEDDTLLRPPRKPAQASAIDDTPLKVGNDTIVTTEEERNSESVSTDATDIKIQESDSASNVEVTRRKKKNRKGKNKQTNNIPVSSEISKNLEHDTNMSSKTDEDKNLTANKENINEEGLNTSNVSEPDNQDLNVTLKEISSQLSKLLSMEENIKQEKAKLTEQLNEIRNHMEQKSSSVKEKPSSSQSDSKATDLNFNPRCAAGFGRGIIKDRFFPAPFNSTGRGIILSGRRMAESYSSKFGDHTIGKTMNKSVDETTIQQKTGYNTSKSSSHGKSAKNKKGSTHRYEEDTDDD